MMRGEHPRAATLCWLVSDPAYLREWSARWPCTSMAHVLASHRYVIRHGALPDGWTLCDQPVPAAPWAGERHA